MGQQASLCLIHWNVAEEHRYFSTPASWPPQGQRHLGQNGNRDFGLTDRTNIEPTGEAIRAIRLGQPRFCQARDPLCMGFFAAQGTDVKSVRTQGNLRQVINLWIMGQRDMAVPLSGGVSSINSSGQRRSSVKPGKRSSVAHAVRGSTIMTS